MTTRKAQREMSTEADARRRLLVVATDSCMGTALRYEILRRSGAAGADVLVVAPALTDRLHFWMSDIDDAIAEADARATEMAESIASREIKVEARVGDEDPLQAIDDAIGTFDPDEVIVVTHPLPESNWLEGAVVAQARTRHTRPITHLEVDPRTHLGARAPERVVPTWLVREQHRRRDWLVLGALGVLAIVGTWISFVFYLVDAPLWVIVTWVVTLDIGFKFVALPLGLWWLFQRRARADRLDY